MILAVACVTLCSSFLVSAAQAAPSPAVTKGIAWLQSQVQASGVLATEALSIATPLQNRAESLQTFKLLATVPSPLADQLAADTQNNTEYLARRAMELNLAGRDASAIIAQLLARQNPDGGFAGAAGYGSDSLDTAWVMLALAQNSQASSAIAQSARSYLLTTIQTDGGVGTGSDSARINASALSLIAVQMFPQDLASATALKQISSWLLLKQGADGSWLGNSNLTALALAAVAPLTTDPTISSTASTYLTGLQGADGSWGGGDPFVTSVVLRALSASAPAAAPTTANSGITGLVVDQATTAPLAGAAVTLSGAATATLTTGANGAINFANLPAGSYTLQIASIGYTSYSAAYQVNTSQTLNIGTIALTQVLTTGIVTGKVTDGATGLALAGAAVTVNAASAVSDANGVYKIAGVTPGAVTLGATATGYAPASATANVLGGQTLAFSPALYASSVAAAPTTGTFTGKVVAAGTGLPLAGVSIQLNGAAAGVTAADGSFNLTLAPASYTAAFTLVGYNSATATFLLTAGGTVNAGTITLTPQLTTTTISGIVKDATTGNPINAAQVQVLNGPVATTGTNGAYTLSGLAGTTFDLRASATGYVTQSLQLTVPQPINVSQDFPLQAQTGLGLSLGALMVNPGSAGSLTDVGIGAIVSNAATGTQTAVVLTLQVVNAGGAVVSTAAAYDKTGTNLLGQAQINPGQQMPVLFKWNTAQFPPGTYSLVARVVAANSITQVTPLGQVLASGQGTLTITPDQHFTGTATANPPVAQAGTNTPIQLSAVLVNDGNTDLPAQAYQLTLINQATSAVVATQQVNGAAFSPNALQSLSFASWTPAAGGGNFKIDVQAVPSSSLGDVVGKLYVGNAATATFSVNQLAVPPGTQVVKGNIHVTGQDVAQGAITDPLAPLIKRAIQKAVTYNDATASSWIFNGRCSGCHVGAQALVGGEKNNRIATYNVAQRNIIFDWLALEQEPDGSFNYAPIQSYLSLWALNYWHAKQDILPALVNGASFVARKQLADGSWLPDWPFYSPYSGWWYSAVITGLNTKSLVDVATSAKQTPANVYSLSPVVTGSQVPGGGKGAAADIAGNLYVTSITSYFGLGTLTLVKPDGTTQTLLSGLVSPHQPVFGSDGALYIATEGGVIRYTLAGQKSVAATARAMSVALGPDGNIYAADYWDGKIIQITPAGGVSDYWTGGGAYLFNPRGVAFDQTGAMLVADPFRGIVRVNPDKTFAVMAIPNGAPTAILQDGANVLVATTLGLVRYDSSWKATLFMPGQRLISSLARTPDGRVLVGSQADQTLSVITSAPMPPPPAFDVPITNAAKWLLVDGNVDGADNIHLAFRLIGLGSANQYFAGTPLGATIRAKMDQVAATLRSRQNADGGWGRGGYAIGGGSEAYNNTSDSMVTSMVGVGLDYLNPSPSDPALQNSIKFLLGRQQADGSWVSEDYVLRTHMAATTWVAIYLPIALDRLGGIDTDLSVSMPASVALANPTMAPASAVANAAGGTDYLWHLPGVQSAGVDVNFDLTLNNMVLGETRPVASNAYLTFNNTFTNQPTTAPISIPRVTASAFLGVGVTTDQVSYPANTPVNITAAVNNTSAAGLLDGSVKLEIYAADNSLVAVVGTPMPFSNLAAGAQTSLTGTWSTGTLAAGGYYVLATLYDSQNRFVGTAQSAFNITAGAGGAVPGFTGVGAALSVNKQTYQPFDLVNISGRISNLTQNQAFSGLQPVVTVYRPDGSVLFTQPRTLAQLLAGAVIDEAYATQLASAPAGQYSVVLSVLNAAAIEVARATTGFTVLSTANTGNGLKGTVGALPKIVPQTDPVVLNWTASNLGNADFAALPLKLTIIDPVTLGVMTQQTYSIPLAQGKTYQTAFTWDTSPANVGSTYVAILAATIGGKDIVLAQDSFLVTYPPVKLGVTQSSVRENRVLVWLACDGKQDAGDGQDAHANDAHGAAKGGDKAAGDTKGKGDSKGKDGHGAHDGKDRPEAMPPCLQTRTAFLQNLLGGIKVPYLITYNREDFRNAFREGRYNVYWLSGDIKLGEGDAEKSGNSGDQNRGDGGQGKAKGKNDHGASERTHSEADREDLLPEEIREAVYRGDSLIQDGVKHGDTMEDAAGLKDGSGQLPGTALALNTAGLVFPAQTLPTTGHALRMRAASGVAQATFVLPANGDDGRHNGDSQVSHANDAGAGGGNDGKSNDGKTGGGKNSGGKGDDQQHDGHHGDDGNKPAPAWPAIVSNEYGRGHALTFGFDLVDTLQNSTAPAAWKAELQTGLTWLMPPLPNPYSAGAYVEFDTDIQNQARQVDLGVAAYLPQGSTLLQTLPQATLDANGQPSWLFTLPQAATQSLWLSMRLPRITGDHKALTTIDSIRNGTRRRYGQYSYDWQVAASDTLGGKLAADLNALVLSGEEEREARAAAVAKLQRAMTLVALPKYGEAIEAMLQAVDQVRKIKSVDTDAIRLNFDNLLQETEWNWLRTGGAAETPDAQHHAH